MKRIRKLRVVASRIKRRPERLNAYKPKAQIYCLIWTFHEYDDDFKPSVPHGHSGKYKLDVMNGNVYRSKERNPVGHASKKELRYLHHDKDFQEYAREHIRWYKENHPQIPVEVPMWLQEPASRRKALVMQKKDNTSLVVVLKTMIIEE